MDTVVANAKRLRAFSLYPHKQHLQLVALPLIPEVTPHYPRMRRGDLGNAANRLHHPVCIARGGNYGSF